MMGASEQDDAIIRERVAARRETIEGKIMMNHPEYAAQMTKLDSGLWEAVAMREHLRATAVARNYVDALQEARELLAWAIKMDKEIDYTIGEG